VPWGRRSGPGTRALAASRTRPVACGRCLRTRTMTSVTPCGGTRAMSTMTLHYVDSHAALDRWAREHGTRARVVEENWESITYATEAVGGDRTRWEFRYRLRLPFPLALRCRERAFIVGLFRVAGGAESGHVRPVIAGLSAAPEEGARRQAVMVGTAQVELQRRRVCGARAAALSPCSVQIPSLWHT